jgi:catechol 2,3-dioxygenase-like lactoylglutathione lyase family enzyme
MKRFHVHVSVEHLPAAVKFYSALFGTSPAVQHADYAKWMLEDPRVNFAISQRGQTKGIHHLGFQVDSSEELEALREQLTTADAAVLQQAGQACCYAQSDKYWVRDPAGIAWEGFHTLGSIPMFGEPSSAAAATACCVPVANVKRRNKKSIAP